jgi:putative DNA primase/helicase
MLGMEFREAAKAVDLMIGRVSEDKIKAPMDAMKIRRQIRKVLSACVKDDPVGYLESRGIKDRPDVTFHPGLGYWEGEKLVGKYPAMIGVVRDVNGKGVAIHRTYLQFRGKADVPSPRKLSGAVGPLNGGSIRLYPVDKGDRVLGVAEGIETACAAHEIFGIPVWSCVNARMLEAFVPPPEVITLVVFGDNDANFCGQKSAYALANRVSASKGMEVEVKIPERVGDWNDQLMEAV